MSSPEQNVALSPDEVVRLAGLARIDLTDDETRTLAPQLEIILDAVARVQEVAEADIPPTSHPLPMTNVFREDVVTQPMRREDALAGAPRTEQDRFEVPQILAEEEQ